jgi:hypothetical protein
MAGTSSIGANGWATAAAAGILVGLLAAHALPSAGAGDLINPSRIAAPAIDRTHKGDRLDAAASISDPHEVGRIALRKLLERARAQQLREMCEPPASPIVDPQLAKLPGRCLT